MRIIEDVLFNQARERDRNDAIKPLPHVITDDDFFFATEEQRREWNARMATGTEPAGVRLSAPLSPTQLTQWQLEDQIDTFHRIERDWKRQGQPLAHIDRLAQLRKCYQYELRNRRLCGPRP